jgi:hypothetical protein
MCFGPFSSLSARKFVHGGVFEVNETNSTCYSCWRLSNHGGKRQPGKSRVAGAILLGDSAFLHPSGIKRPAKLDEIGIIKKKTVDTDSLMCFKCDDYARGRSGRARIVATNLLE